MFIELCFIFMYVFTFFNPHVVSCFPCLATSLSYAILSQAGLLEIPVTYLESLGYFLARSLVLQNGCSLEKLMLNGGVQSVQPAPVP
jgi:hypothetical protein